MFSRRKFLLEVGLLFSTVLLEKCSFKYLAKMQEMEESTPYFIEEKLRNQKLAINKSNRLRRYKGFPSDPQIRELELISLARTEMSEESFAYVRPENVWYEIGVEPENHGCLSENHRKMEKYSSTLLGNMDYLFSGSFKGIPKPKEIIRYHFHPVFLKALYIYELGDHTRKSKTEFKSLEDWVYSACLKPYPSPAINDYLVDKVCKERFSKMNIKITSRVADHSGVWKFGLNKNFINFVYSKKVSPVSFFKYFKGLTNIINSVSNNMVFENKINTASEYICALEQEFKRAKFPKNPLQISYNPTKDIFKPSEQEFLKMLRGWKLIV